MTKNETTEKVQKVLSFIAVGKENAITQARLADLTGFSRSRVKHYIHVARNEFKTPVMSDNEGYYFPATTDERHAFEDKKHRQAVTLLQTIKNIKGDKDDTPGQMHFTDKV